MRTSLTVLSTSTFYFLKIFKKIIYRYRHSQNFTSLTVTCIHIPLCLYQATLCNYSSCLYRILVLGKYLVIFNHSACGTILEGGSCVKQEISSSFSSVFNGIQSPLCNEESQISGGETETRRWGQLSEPPLNALGTSFQMVMLVIRHRSTVLTL